MASAAPLRAVLLGVPSDLGASKPGASEGPAAIRKTGLAAALKEIGLNVEDQGDVEVPPAQKKSSPSLKNAAAILKVCRELEKRLRSLAKPGILPIVLGGDHSVAIGAIAGVAGAYRARGARIGLIWVDAHADINTPKTSPSGNVHGMPLAHVLGLGHAPLARLGGSAPKVSGQSVCLIGTRSVDSSEAGNLKKSGAKVFSMQDIDRLGIGRVMESALAIVSDGTAGFYLSFDIDAVDPQQAPGTGTTKRGGLTYRESHLLMEMAAESGKLLALDLVEVNPLEDIQNTTAALAAELIASAAGKKIY